MRSICSRRASCWNWNTAMQPALLPIASLTLEMVMNWNVIEGNWTQYKDQVKAQWGKLTNDHLDLIAGNRDQLTGQIRESYGIAQEEADMQVASFEKYLRDSRPS